MQPRKTGDQPYSAASPNCECSLPGGIFLQLQSQNFISKLEPNS